MQILRCFVAAAILLVSSAQAAVVNIDFDSAEGYVVAANYVDSGFTFSPSGHYDIWGNTNFMGFDAAAFDAINLDFMGTHAISSAGPRKYAYLYVTFEGGPFSLVGLTAMTQNWSLISSKGAVFVPFDPNGPTVPFDAAFDLPEWKGIDWLLFYTDAGMPEGFDNFVAEIQVPEPSSLALLCLGILALMACRRRIIFLPG